MDGLIMKSGGQGGRRWSSANPREPSDAQLFTPMSCDVPDVWIPRRSSSNLGNLHAFLACGGMRGGDGEPTDQWGKRAKAWVGFEKFTILPGMELLVRGVTAVPRDGCFQRTGIFQGEGYSVYQEDTIYRHCSPLVLPRRASLTQEHHDPWTEGFRWQGVKRERDRGACVPAEGPVLRWGCVCTEHATRGLHPHIKRAWLHVSQRDHQPCIVQGTGLVALLRLPISRIRSPIARIVGSATNKWFLPREAGYSAEQYSGRIRAFSIWLRTRFDDSHTGLLSHFPLANTTGLPDDMYSGLEYRPVKPVCRHLGLSMPHWYSAPYL